MRHKQTGVTLVGWVIILAIVGVFALAAMRLIPIYAEKLEVHSLLTALEEEYDGQRVSAPTLRNAIKTKMQIKDISVIRHTDFEVTAIKNGYEVHIYYEHKAPFIADVGLFVTVDRKVEINR